MKFKLNEKVFNPKLGEGTVISIIEGARKPVKVRYDSGSEYAYTEEGKVYESNLIPSIFKKGTRFIIVEPEPKPVFNKGDIVLVWDNGRTNNTSNILKSLAIYSHYSNGKHYVLVNTLKNNNDNSNEHVILCYDNCELFDKGKFINS